MGENPKKMRFKKKPEVWIGLTRSARREFHTREPICFQGPNVGNNFLCWGTVRPVSLEKSDDLRGIGSSQNLHGFVFYPNYNGKPLVF